MSLIHSHRFLIQSNASNIIRFLRSSAPLFKKGPEKIHHLPLPGYDPDGWKRLPENTPETDRSVEDWMRVRYKNKNVKERIIHAMAVDDRLVTESKDAEKISDDKLRALEASLVARGFCRERVPYDPPENVEELLKDCLEKLDPASQLHGSWLDFPLNDHVFKFKFLTLCASKFNHEVPNSDLHQMRRVRDVLSFYTTPIQGMNNYDKLVRDREQLPPNLTVIPEIKRFSPDDEGVFGVDPMPGMPDVVRGLRGQKKYPALKSTIDWPDI